MENMNTVMRSCLKSTFSCFLVAVEKWEVDLCAIQSKLEEKKICNWKAKYENLEEEKEKLAKEMLSEIKKIMPEKRKEQEN